MLFLRRVLPAVVILLSAGCASVEGPVRAYEGPPRTATEVATLTAPQALEVLSVDGRKLELPYGEGEYEVHMLPGSHRIRAAYRETWGDATSSILVVSDVVVFDAEVGAGQRLRLDYAAPENMVEAQRFADNPRMWLEDGATGRRVEPVDIASRGSIMNRIAREAAVGGAADAPAPAATAAPDNAAAAEDMLLRQDALERLKFWWKLAPVEDRAAFKEWMAGQE